MPFEEDGLRDRAERSEAIVGTLRENLERVKEQHREMMDLLGARRTSSGAIDIDFDKLAANLDPEFAEQLKAIVASPAAALFEVFVQKLTPGKWLELRAIGDRFFRISGEAGQKPRIKISADSGESQVKNNTITEARTAVSPHE